MGIYEEELTADFTKAAIRSMLRTSDLESAAENIYRREKALKKIIAALCYSMVMPTELRNFQHMLPIGYVAAVSPEIEIGEYRVHETDYLKIRGRRF